jgi:hypothetical protein
LKLSSIKLCSISTKYWLPGRLQYHVVHGRAGAVEEVEEAEDDMRGVVRWGVLRWGVLRWGVMGSGGERRGEANTNVGLSVS